MATLKGDGKMIFMVFVGAIITAVLIAPIADQVFAETNTIDIANVTFTPSGTGNGTVELTGRELVGTAIVTNATNGTILNTGNYTVTNEIGTDGLLSVTLTTTDASLADPRASGQVNVSYTANPDGFVNGGAARSIFLLVTLFAALAVVVFVITVLFFPGTSLSQLVRGRMTR